MRPLAAILIALLWCASALAAPAASLNLSLAPGVDTNPYRTVGQEAAPDGYLAATATAKARLGFGQTQTLDARYDLGLKKFTRDTGEDLAVQQLALDYSLQAGTWIIGAEAASKLRLSRAADRDYFDGNLDLYADKPLSRSVLLRFWAGARRFDYPPDMHYSSLGPTAGAQLRWTPIRRVTLTFLAHGALPTFDLAARQPDGFDGPERRRDQVAGAQFSAGYRGPVALQASYQFLAIRSNSFGESTQRHRLAGALSTKLPLDLYAVVQGAFQFIRYPDGIFVSRDLLLLDDESQSSVAAKLAWPVTASLDLEARYGLYWIVLPPRNQLAEASTDMYLRQVGSLGLALRW